MPIIKSAKKRTRQAAKHYARNVQTKKSLRSALKAFDAAVKSGSGDKVIEAQRIAQSSIDTAVKKNLMHANKAARLVAQMNTKAKTVSSKPTKAPAAAKSTTTKKPAAKKPAAKKTTSKSSK